MNTAILLVSFLGCFGEFREWHNATPVQSTNREIVVADVRLFRVLTVAEAERNRDLSGKHERHFEDEVKTYNRPALYWAWKAECDWRWRCWHDLSIALNDNPTVTGYQDTQRIQLIAYMRVNALERLRELLGDEAFWAGRMPSPIPNYRVPHNP